MNVFFLIKDVRTYLRPLALTPDVDMVKVYLKTKKSDKILDVDAWAEQRNDGPEDPFKELSKNAEKLNADDYDEEEEEEKNCYIEVPLDPVTFNELEVNHIHSGHLGVVLRE